MLPSASRRKASNNLERLILNRALLLIFAVLSADQILKIWIKLSWPLGHSYNVIGSKFQLHFIENPGMAFGLEFGGEWGKIALSLFRLVAISGIAWYLLKMIREQQHKGFIYAVSLILAGAIGNMIDSAFYGLIFDKGSVWNGHYYEGYLGLADFCNPGNGYQGFLRGNVVDMLYFPLFEGTFPQWLPIWGGEHFQFFRPVFNIADAAISIGVALIIIRQKTYFSRHHDEQQETTQDQVSSAEEVKSAENQPDAPLADEQK
jgi:signal peptidase II